MSIRKAFLCLGTVAALGGSLGCEEDAGGDETVDGGTETDQSATGDGVVDAGGDPTASDTTSDDSDGPSSDELTESDSETTSSQSEADASGDDPDTATVTDEEDGTSTAELDAGESDTLSSASDTSATEEPSTEPTDPASDDSVEETESDTPSDGSDAGTTEDSTDGGVIDDTDTPPEALPLKTALLAFVQVHVAVADVTMTNAGFSAYFVEYDALGTEPPAPEPEPVEDPCTSVTLGDCTAQTCPVVESGGAVEADAGVPAEAPTELPFTQFEAGGITITGLLVDPLVPEYASIFELSGLETPEGALIGYNTSPSLLQALWSGTETAQIHVIAGGEVPEFNIAFAPPTPVVLSAPVAASSGASVAVDPSDALNVSWSNGGTGDVYVAVSGPVGDATRSITCTSESATGGISIDAALLAGLDGSGTIAMMSTASVTGQQGEWVYSVSGQDQGPAQIVTFTP